MISTILRGWCFRIARIVVIVGHSHTSEKSSDGKRIMHFDVFSTIYKFDIRRRKNGFENRSEGVKPEIFFDK